MAGIKRKEAPKAAPARPSEHTKKQKLATHTKSASKTKPTKKPVPQPSESEDEDDDEDMLDGQELSEGDSSDSESEGAGVALRPEGGASGEETSDADGEKKIRSTYRTVPEKTRSI